MDNYMDFQRIFDENEQLVTDEFVVDLKLIMEIYDRILPLASSYATIRSQMGLGDNKHLDIIFSTVYKSLVNIYSIVDLNVHGNIGSARIIMRNVFEFLVIGKYIMLHDKREIRNKWDNVEYINLNREVFGKTIYPDNESKQEFLKLWSLFCQYTHATKASGQVVFEYKDIKEDIHVNLDFVYILLLMIYHYFNRYLSTQYIKDYLKSLEHVSEGIRESCRFQEELKTLTRLAKKRMTSTNMLIISYYCAKWRITEEKITKSAHCEIIDSDDSPIIQEIGNTKKTVSNLMRNKNDILKGIHRFITAYKGKKNIAGYPIQYRRYLVKTMSRLSEIVAKSELPILKDERCFYDYDINVTSVDLSLYHYGLLDIDYDGNITSATHIKTIVTCKCNYLNVDQYANAYNVSTHTVMQWIKHAKLRSAERIIYEWWIPELAPRPKAGYSHVHYWWNSLSKSILELYPYLKGYSSITIDKSKSERDMYECILSSRNRKKQVSISINRKDRERLEYDLLHNACVEYDEPKVFWIP